MRAWAVMSVRSTVEALMYLAFSAAALPMAWLGVSDILYYQAHPEMLESRDSAPVVMSVVWAVYIMLPALGAAVLLALCFLLGGPRAVRMSSLFLISAWILMFVLVPSTAFASVARLYWDAVPFVVLAILPWLCAGVRLVLRYAGASSPTSGEGDV